MFPALGRFTHRRRGWVLAVAALLLVLAGLYGPGVSNAVKSGGYDDPGSESARADALLEETFGRSAADVVVVFSHDSLAAGDPAFAGGVNALLADVPSEAVEGVITPWTPGLPAESAQALLGSDGRSALALITLTGQTHDEREAGFEQIEPALHAEAPWTTHVGGFVPVNAQMQVQAETDIARAEMLAMPILVLPMLVIFGGLVAALLPVTIGVVAILGAMGLLRLLTEVTDISSFAMNVTTILGLGLAIDYSLFMVSRFREELGEGSSTDEVGRAVRRTVSTAGRTVVFSGVTVLIAFAGLLFFPQMFLRSMGIGGMAVVLLDMVLAVTLLPAILSLLGRRVDAGRLPSGVTAWFSRRRRDAAGTATSSVPDADARDTAAARDGVAQHRGWARWARVVMRRPGLMAAGAVALLVVVALPVGALQVGDADARELPASASSRQASEQIDALFPAESGAAFEVVVDGPLSPETLAGYVAELTAVDGVSEVHEAGRSGDVTHLVASTTQRPDSPEARAALADIRDVADPAGTQVLVGGAAAQSADSIAAITATAPWTALFIAGVTMVLLFLALGSIVAPIKAVVLNLLSLAATFGAIAWAFSQGHLAPVLGFTDTGAVAPGNLVLIAVVAFGLAMDYELFLLSRIREAHLAGEDSAQAITTGLVRSGSTITSAALLLVVVLAAMATSGVTFLKLIGLGLAFAVALDATVVRAMLVPAVLRLLGPVTWWLPAPLRRFHDRFGISEGDDEQEPRPGTGAVVPTPASVPAGVHIARVSRA